MRSLLPQGGRNAIFELRPQRLPTKIAAEVRWAASKVSAGACRSQSRSIKRNPIARPRLRYATKLVKPDSYFD